MSGFDPSSLLQTGSLIFFVIFMIYGQKLQILSTLASISSKMRKLATVRDDCYRNLNTHIAQHVNITPEGEKRLHALITSIAIPPVSLDTGGIVPKIKHTMKTYMDYLKSNLVKIVGDVSQSELENLTNSLEVAIETDIFYRVVDHYYRKAKKGNMMSALMLQMALGELLEMGEALQAASGHFQSGLPIGDGFGPMVASRVAKGWGKGKDESTDKETSVFHSFYKGRDIITVKARGPGGSVGNPAEAIAEIATHIPLSMAVTIDAGLRMESEKTGDVSEGIGVAMGGNGTERFEIEAVLAQFRVPTYTLVCKMSMKEAITQMPKEVLDQVDPTYQRVLGFIEEYSQFGQVVLVVGVGNTMGVE